jgi:hypothetical protein
VTPIQVCEFARAVATKANSGELLAARFSNPADDQRRLLTGLELLRTNLGVTQLSSATRPAVPDIKTASLQDLVRGYDLQLQGARR